MNRVNTIGRNSSTDDVVSNMITANEKVILVLPAKTAVAPMIAKVDALISLEGNIKRWSSEYI